jgi:hypothetical protein
MSGFTRILIIWFCGLAGGIGGYMAGAYAACYWFWPESNLCGLLGVFITGPAGLLVGILASLWFTRSRNRPPKP